MNTQTTENAEAALNTTPVIKTAGLQKKLQDLKSTMSAALKKYSTRAFEILIKLTVAFMVLLMLASIFSSYRLEIAYTIMPQDEVVRITELEADNVILEGNIAILQTALVEADTTMAAALIPEQSFSQLFDNRVAEPVSNAYQNTKDALVTWWQAREAQ